MRTPTIKFILRSNYKRVDGSQGVYLRYTQKRKSHYVSLNISIIDKKWDPDKCRIKFSAKDSYNLNTLLDGYENKARQILFDHRVAGKLLTSDLFKKLFLDENYGSESFYKYVEKQIAQLAGIFAPGTIKGYRDQVNKLKSFKAELLFEEITPQLVESYKRFLVSGRSNNKNTISKSQSFVRSMLNRAKKDGLIDSHVFQGIVKIERIKGNREFLTLDELTRIEKLYYSKRLKPNKDNVLRYFLFSCFTGLRYGDVRDLRFANIHDNKWVSIIMHKTDQPVRIPIIERARKLIPEPGFNNQNVFNVLTDQPTNRYLKEIMATAGIKKRISFHCARHTFATCSIGLGMREEIIARILGHVDNKSVKEYARIEDFVKETEMEKWN